MLTYSVMLFRKVYATDVVGVIPDELWTLTSLTNLYGFTFLCITMLISHDHVLLNVISLFSFLTGIWVKIS